MQQKVVEQTTVDLLKDKARKSVDQLDEQLRELNLRIHQNPEFGFEEYQACQWLCGFLRDRGFTVQQGVANLPTAFVASYGGQLPGPRIAVMVEYDALPETGHGCGHSMIGPVGVGAAVTLKEIWPELPGEIMVIGTPAEEEGGGKVFMVEAGIFDGLDAVVIAHPTNMNLVGGGSLAMRGLTVEITGKVAHACSNPQMGVNALSALINTFNLIDGQRQHLHPDVRINGVITNGGEAPNIIPGYASAKFQLMALNDEMLDSVTRLVSRSATSAASALGAEAKITETTHYKARWANSILGQVFGDSMAAEGLPVQQEPKDLGWGYTDTGNVSQVAPTTSVYFKIAGPTVFNHMREFAEAVPAPEAQSARLKVTKALVAAFIDLFANPGILSEARAELAAKSR